MSNPIAFHPDGAIFDMDGLMLDTERPYIPLWSLVGKSFGWDISPELVQRAVGINSRDVRALFLQEYGADFPHEAITAKLEELIKKEFEKGVPHRPGLIVLLDHLASLGIPLAVATSTSRTKALWKLEKAGILDRFQALATGDEVANGKPAPDIFLLAAERLNQDPSRCIGFEDSPAGLRGLSAAGIRSIFVEDMVKPPEAVLATVWHTCADLSEAVHLIV